jgi:REP element-mobilizing transposase RayT
MTQARRRQVSLVDTPYYHCIARCVRRAFLCGEDRHTGQSFEHRRQWVVDRLRFLADVFAIDICAYAIMSNHYHVVVHVDWEQVVNWSNTEVIRRWCCLYKGNLLSQRFMRGDHLSRAELDVLQQRIEVWRGRLSDISWFMKQLNESIARAANIEDSCKGRFWEARFKSQALLDEKALLACMAYVDLNPVRAGIADDVESSDFTSVQVRLWQVAGRRSPLPSNHDDSESSPPRLLPFTEAEHVANQRSALPFNLRDYLDLVDWTGRCVREDKRGAINTSKPRLLDRLRMSEGQWKALAIDIQRQAFCALGDFDRLDRYHTRVQKRWMPRQGLLLHCYERAA